MSRRNPTGQFEFQIFFVLFFPKKFPPNEKKEKETNYKLK